MLRNAAVAECAEMSLDEKELRSDPEVERLTQERRARELTT